MAFVRTLRLNLYRGQDPLVITQSCQTPAIYLFACTILSHSAAPTITEGNLTMFSPLLWLNSSPSQFYLPYGSASTISYDPESGTKYSRPNMTGPEAVITIWCALSISSGTLGAFMTAMGTSSQHQTASDANPEAAVTGITIYRYSHKLPLGPQSLVVVRDRAHDAGPLKGRMHSPISHWGPHCVLWDDHRPWDSGDCIQNYARPELRRSLTALVDLCSEAFGGLAASLSTNTWVWATFLQSPPVHHTHPYAGIDSLLHAYRPGWIEFCVWPPYTNFHETPYRIVQRRPNLSVRRYRVQLLLGTFYRRSNIPRPGFPSYVNFRVDVSF
ncbi:hypothetical protein PM082_011743 [Marasmius tenuissimus]|nr:hypothetical protein PM082_011743 [Marasmius tenuissimus]